MRILAATLLVVLAGFATGSCGWPLKVVRTYRFEHTWFVAMLTGLVVLPWGVTLALCPGTLSAWSALEPAVLLRANLLSVAWGIANVISGLCVVRIGFVLTGAVLSGVGMACGTILPLVVKAEGQFGRTPDLGSPAGLAILTGVAMTAGAVVLVAVAGFGRERQLAAAGAAESTARAGSFLPGLILCAVGGLLSTGLAMSFVYSQEAVRTAMSGQDARGLAPGLAVWAFGTTGGAVVNLAYPAWRMTRDRSWGTLVASGRDAALAACLGAQFFVAIMVLMGQGMLLFGALGASVGFGLQQITQLLGGQGVGFVWGEWRGVNGRPWHLMVTALILLTAASLVLAFGSRL